jgi:carbamate kinase
VVSVLTRVVVDSDDPAFSKPSKPIGPFYSQQEAEYHRDHDGWNIVEDSGRGYRRVVASPQPRAIVELDAIRTLSDAGYILVAVGGGGIPVVRESEGVYRGVEAVIDKDLASSLLAADLKADLLLISTGVARVAINFRKPDQRELEHMTLDEARRYMAEGQFPAGSMGPKIGAAMRFLEDGGRQVLITSPEMIAEALAGRSGTWITAGPRVEDTQVAVAAVPS